MGIRWGPFERVAACAAAIMGIRDFFGSADAARGRTAVTVGVTPGTAEVCTAHRNFRGPLHICRHQATGVYPATGTQGSICW